MFLTKIKEKFEEVIFSVKKTLEEKSGTDYLRSKKKTSKIHRMHTEDELKKYLKIGKNKIHKILRDEKYIMNIANQQEEREGYLDGFRLEASKKANRLIEDIVDGEIEVDNYVNSGPPVLLYSEFIDGKNKITTLADNAHKIALSRFIAKKEIKVGLNLDPYKEIRSFLEERDEDLLSLVEHFQAGDIQSNLRTTITTALEKLIDGKYKVFRKLDRAINLIKKHPNNANQDAIKNYEKLKEIILNVMRYNTIYSLTNINFDEVEIDENILGRIKERINGIIMKDLKKYKNKNINTILSNSNEFVKNIIFDHISSWNLENLLSYLDDNSLKELNERLNNDLISHIINRNFKDETGKIAKLVYHTIRNESLDLNDLIEGYNLLINSDYTRSLMMTKNKAENKIKQEIKTIIKNSLLDKIEDTELKREILEKAVRSSIREILNENADNDLIIALQNYVSYDLIAKRVIDEFNAKTAEEKNQLLEYFKNTETLKGVRERILRNYRNKNGFELVKLRVPAEVIKAVKGEGIFYNYYKDKKTKENIDYLIKAAMNADFDDKNKIDEILTTYNIRDEYLQFLKIERRYRDYILVTRNINEIIANVGDLFRRNNIRIAVDGSLCKKDIDSLISATVEDTLPYEYEDILRDLENPTFRLKYIYYLAAVHINGYTNGKKQSLILRDVMPYIKENINKIIETAIESGIVDDGIKNTINIQEVNLEGIYIGG